jgi:L-lactate dehydrogenase
MTVTNSHQPKGRPLGTTRIAVVGAGHVGATFAYSLLRTGLASEIVLLDADRTRAEGEAMDLAHAAPFERPARVWAGDWPDLAGSVLVVVAAGAGQRPGQTRLDLAQRNATILRDICGRVAEAAPDAILLIATNPVDVLTHVALQASGFPPSRVIGSGTLLDTARFRALLAERYGVDPRSVHVFIIGEHGDSEVPVWSLANIAGMRLTEYAVAHGEPYPHADLDEIFRATRDAAYRIIERKGATYYAIASGLVRVVEAILRDQHTVMSVSSLVEGPFDLHDVCLSLPAVIGRNGIERVLPITLDASEEAAFRHSAEVVRAAIEGLALR